VYNTIDDGNIYKIREAIVMRMNDSMAVFRGLNLSVIEAKDRPSEPVACSKWYNKGRHQVDASADAMPADAATSRPTFFAMPMAISPESVPIV